MLGMLYNAPRYVYKQQTHTTHVHRRTHAHARTTHTYTAWVEKDISNIIGRPHSQLAILC